MSELERWLDDAVAARRPVLIATDYDGTLARIVGDPGRADPLPHAFETLSRLAALPRVRVAVLTGRGVEDALARFAGLRGAWICAEHGSVVIRPDGHVQTNEPVERRAGIPLLVREALHLAAEAEGVRVEVKEGSVALHVREVLAVENRARVASAFRRMALDRGATLLEGRMVVEARFRTGNKGTALSTLLGRLSATTSTLYAGDDITDEHAFEVVRALPFGLTIHVASDERPAARVAVDAVVPSPDAWVQLLSHVAETLSARTLESNHAS